MNIFNQLYRSLFSPKDISSFRHQGIGKTILYVFFLTLLSVLPSIYHLYSAINGALEITKETIKEELPAFSIENGQLHSTEDMPITINKGHFSIIFDSTGSIDSGHISKSGNTFAFLKNEFVLSAAGEVNSFSYSMLSIDHITKEEISSFIEHSDSALAIILPIFFLISYLFSSALAFVNISILAAIGILLKNIVRKPLQYRHLWRMTAYSITLPTFFFTIMSLLQTQVPFGFFIDMFVSLIILLLAIKEVPDEPQLKIS